jgi:hypothetical protein
MRPTLLAASAVIAVLGFAPGAGAADLPKYTIDPHDTDPAILDTPSPTPGTRGKHLVWLPPADHAVGRLLVFLPTGGPTNLPSEFTELGTVARRLGYHTVFLAYRNEAPIAANPPAGCGPLIDPPVADKECAIKIRKEILDGLEESPIVNIDAANSIENRLNKVLRYLADNHAEEGWGDFLDASREPKWAETVIVGSSLGAGEAAIIAERHDVYRAALLHGWVDAKHKWVTIGKTPPADYFTLIHAHDNFYERTCWAYKDLKLVADCPLENPPLIENHDPPFGTQVHVFDLTPGSTMGTGDIFHQSTSRDGWIARETDGTPSHHLVNAWRSVLGDRDADTYLDEADNCKDVANDQQDADGDRQGDRCDATPRGTTPPVIAAPSFSVDATGPAGALVSYTATATDDLDPAPPVTCAPAAGTRFAIGATTVTCTATDLGQNTAQAAFVVTVRGAPEQLGRLVLKVGGSPRLAALFAGVDPSRPLQRLALCLTLRAFVTLVPFLAPQATEWVADANRIRAVLAC